MQGSAGDFEYTCVSERIGYGGSVRLPFLLLISLRLKALDIREADGSLGLVILTRVVILVGLARSEDVKLEGSGLQGRL